MEQGHTLNSNLHPELTEKDRSWPLLQRKIERRHAIFIVLYGTCFPENKHSLNTVIDNLRSHAVEQWRYMAISVVTFRLGRHRQQTTDSLLAVDNFQYSDL